MNFWCGSKKRIILGRNLAKPVLCYDLTTISLGSSRKGKQLSFGLLLCLLNEGLQLFLFCEDFEEVEQERYVVMLPSDVLYSPVLELLLFRRDSKSQFIHLVLEFSSRCVQLTLPCRPEGQGEHHNPLKLCGLATNEQRSDQLKVT